MHAHAPIGSRQLLPRLACAPLAPLRLALVATATARAHPCVACVPDLHASPPPPLAVARACSGYSRRARYCAATAAATAPPRAPPPSPTRARSHNLDHSLLLELLLRRALSAVPCSPAPAPVRTAPLRRRLPLRPRPSSLPRSRARWRAPPLAEALLLAATFPHRRCWPRLRPPPAGHREPPRPSSRAAHCGALSGARCERSSYAGAPITRMPAKASPGQWQVGPAQKVFVKKVIN
nr:atherin-like [Aegilops tauschii subsp. strangulata]